MSRARRDGAGQDRKWLITTAPTGNEAVTITLPATTDCSDVNAVRTADGAMLSEAVTTALQAACRVGALIMKKMKPTRSLLAPYSIVLLSGVRYGCSSSNGASDRAAALAKADTEAALTPNDDPVDLPRMPTVERASMSCSTIT